MQNPGKRFEEDWKASVPKDVYYLRLKDGPAWSHGDARFFPKNEYDCQLYKYPVLVALELKSVARKSIRFDALSPHQGEGLRRASRHSGLWAGVVVNFRNDGSPYTFFIPIDEWDRLESDIPKKSFNVDDLATTSRRVPVQSTLRRTRWRYNIHRLLEELA